MTRPSEAQLESDEASGRRRALPAPADSADSDVAVQPDKWTTLQRTYGNRWVQRVIGAQSSSAGPQGGPLEDGLIRQIQAERSNGRPLEPTQRAQAEEALREDLSSVRVHTDAASAELNTQLGARAFTIGRDIFFSGDASPSDPSVLLHESTHALQQGMGTEPPVAVGAADTAYEQAADAAAVSRRTMRQRPGDEELAAIATRTIQREDADGGQSEDIDWPSADISFDVPWPAAQDYTPEHIAAVVPGYKPPQEEMPSASSPGTAMALRQTRDGLVQRDDPHPSADVGVQYPWSVQFTFIYRDLNLIDFRDRLGKVDVLHEPQATIAFSPDPDGWLAGQLAIAVLNQHLHFWSQDTEAQIAMQMNAIIKPKLMESYGVNLQVEQHVWKGWSATFSAGGFWTPPMDGNGGRLDFSASGGLVLHLDGG